MENKLYCLLGHRKGIVIALFDFRPARETVPAT
jgi:hypothetical protein